MQNWIQYQNPPKDEQREEKIEILTKLQSPLKISRVFQIVKVGQLITQSAEYKPKAAPLKKYFSNKFRSKTKLSFQLIFISLKNSQLNPSISSPESEFFERTSIN